MRQAEIIAVGKVNASYFREGCAEFMKRISPMCRLNVTEIPEAKLSGSGAAAEKQVIDTDWWPPALEALLSPDPQPVLVEVYTETELDAAILKDFYKNN